MPNLSLRLPPRPRASSGPSTETVTPSGGAWTIPSGTGTLTSLALNSTPAPTLGDIVMDSSPPGLSVTISAGQTAASDPGPMATTGDVLINPDTSTASGGPFTLSGQVRYTSSGGAVTTYILGPMVK